MLYRQLIPYGPPSAFRRQPQAERNEAIVEDFSNYHSTSSSSDESSIITERKIALIELKIELVQLQVNHPSEDEDEQVKIQQKIKYYSDKLEETKKALLQEKGTKEFVEQVEKEESISELKNMISKLTLQQPPKKDDCSLN
ncbi:hypothetical protein C9374_010965 [Naegleria lovaniensis]|uniref:Uncharacterized protein n=1 Tax=Naegleria lovaniensis TaxID=51637 RepID=A0AA88GF89_NAELO|nr:uncharacterized protein C9374_010965 [Naegleria lovaniensis]KAG2374395.1 hypothetical protein C9374_010965 [Naegleria lovaniensis]